MKPVTVFLSQGSVTLKGNWGKSALLTLLFLIMFIALVFITSILFGRPLGANTPVTTKGIILGCISTLVFLVVCMPLGWSYTTMFLSIKRGGNVSPSQLLSGYGDVSRIVIGYFIITLCTVLCLLLPARAGWYLFGAVGVVLLYFVGIIAGLYIRILFSQFDYVIFDDEDLSAFDALQESARLMKGHKLQFFLLQLLLGIIVAAGSIITLGIGMFFLLPYMQSVNANFYESLTSEETEDPVETTAAGDGAAILE